MHPNSDWFLIWLETDYPGEIVVTNGTETRPVVTWRTMGGPLKLHLLTASDVKSLLRKQMTMFTSNTGVSVSPPPHWSLGYHLCRSSGDSRDFRNDITGMSDASIPIQFDTDCIDEQLVKSAFELNPKFSTLQNDFDKLKQYKKSFLLPLVAQRSFDNSVGQSEGCLVEDSEPNSQCYMGKLMGENVMYPDMSKTDWLQRDFDKFLTKLDNISNHQEVKGWHLHGSQPLDQDSDSLCDNFQYTPRDGDLRSGLLCQHAWVTSWNTSLVAGHARYSHEVSLAFANLAEAKYQFHEVFRYGGGHWAGHQGGKVGATWTGLGTSLREVLVLGMMGQAMVAMPVCGTHTVTDLDMPDMDLGKLCLRWAQLAAFMPAMRSWYADNDNIRYLHHRQDH